MLIMSHFYALHKKFMSDVCMLGTQHDRRLLFTPSPSLHAMVEGSGPNKSRLLWWVAGTM